ncbi:MAG: type II secretion system secretin GspD [Gammaproteobacteria bacterium]|nr:type II secretion system secretin GspD [Gammaproteobacteria bacterium]
MLFGFAGLSGVHAEPMTLNLKNADITAVISTVSEMTGKNFIIDPRVKGKVTIISSEPMEADAIYQVFLSVLSVHGFAAIPGDNVTKIVPSVNAKQGPVPTVTSRHPGQGDEFITRVIQVDNVTASQLVPILRPLMSQQDHLAAYQPSNVLIASGNAANVQRLVKIINRIDLSGDDEIEVMPLEHASATEVVRILESLEKSGGAGKKNVDSLTLVADERTNSILISGGKSQRLRLRTIISHLDTPLQSSGNTEVIYLRYAKAEDLAPILSGVGTSLGEGGKKKSAAPAANGKVNIQADVSNNALVINAPPDLMRSLKSVIRKLDVRRAQVLIEAVIAEISSDKNNELGIAWGADGSASNNPVGIINFGGVESLLSDPPGIGKGLSLVVGDTQAGTGTRFGAMVRALAGRGNTNILSTPSIVTMDNEEAEMIVGENVPITTGSFTGTGDASNTSPFQTIERQDVGLTLRVKPQISEGSAIKLDIEQEVSSIAQAATETSDIITNKRSLKTMVMVDDGQAVVLGGLIEEQLRESVQKVPVLGSIPILGWFFSYKATSKVKTNLMVFLKPVIMRDAAQTAAITANKYNNIREQQQMFREQGISLMADSESPLLSDWDDFMTLPPVFDEASVPLLMDELDAVPSPANRFPPPSIGMPPAPVFQ